MAPHPEVLFRCWSCHGKFQHVDGISLLDGDSATKKTSQVCGKCWRSIPIAQRILLIRLNRPLSDAGLGLMEAVQKLLDVHADLEKIAQQSKSEQWEVPDAKEMEEILPEDEPEEYDPDFNPGGKR